MKLAGIKKASGSFVLLQMHGNLVSPMLKLKLLAKAFPLTVLQFPPFWCSLLPCLQNVPLPTTPQVISNSFSSFPPPSPSFIPIEFLLCMCVCVCVCVCLCACVYVCVHVYVCVKRKEYNVYILFFRFSCIHFCWSCKSWCAHPRWWNTMLQKWLL